MDSGSIVGKPAGADFGEIVITLPARMRGLVRVRVEFAEETGRRRRQLGTDELDAKRNEFLSIINDNPTLIDDPSRLAQILGVHRTTVWRWIQRKQKEWDDMQRNRRAQN